MDKDLFKKMLSLLGHRNSLLWKAKQHKGSAEAIRRDREELSRQITEHERKNTDAMGEVFHINNALHKMHTMIPNQRCVEFMNTLYNATEDETDSAYEEFRPQDILADVLFNG
jgi:hypothetical protein